MYREIMQSGYQVNGLKEKLQYLEQVYEEELKKKYAEQAKAQQE